MSNAAAPWYRFPLDGLPVPVVAGYATHTPSSMQNVTSRSAVVSYIAPQRRPRTYRLPQINFTGAVCLCIIAAGYASPDALKSSRLLDVAIACGIVGYLLTLGALFLDRGRGGQLFLFLNLLSAAVGTIAMVAATQAWEIAVAIGVCVVVIAGAVWWLKVSAR